MVTYFFRKKSIRFLFHLMDLCLKVPTRKVPINTNSILLSHPAHLGDVIIMTTLLPLLKKAFPHIKIGVLVSQQSAQVIKNHPLVDCIHTIDHWKTNRAQNSFYQKFAHYHKTRKQALKEIRKQNYDISVDCNFHFPNLAPLLYQAKIPTRIGFTSAGFSTFLTHPIEWGKKKQPVAAYFLDLLKVIHPFSDVLLKPNLIRRDFSEIKHKVYHPNFIKSNYVVLHMGSGDHNKKWPKENWKKLVQRISPIHLILLTGRGIEERKDILYVMHEQKNVINLCDQCSFDDFVCLIEHAKYYLGVDSCGGHIASAFYTPSLLIYHTTSSLWNPSSPFTQVLHKPTFENVIASMFVFEREY